VGRGLAPAPCSVPGPGRLACTAGRTVHLARAPDCPTPCHRPDSSPWGARAGPPGGGIRCRAGDV